MIKLLTSKTTGYVYAGIAVCLLAWWGYTHIYNNGYAAAESHYTAVIAAEHAAAATARNDEVERQAARQNESKAREAARIAEMQAETESLNQKIEELQREASEDPDAGRTAIGAPSVQRINKVR
ncbi:hypothetical protein [Rhizobium leguminosarum]